MKKAGLREWIPPLAVALLAVAVYLNSFPGSFIIDDVVIVRDNPLVNSFDVTGIFTTDYWGRWHNSGLYRPLPVFSYALNRALFGPAPFSFHLINVLLHAAVCALFAVTLLAAGTRRSVAWLAASLFAVHTVHTEVVNEVVGRAELLAGLFIFLGLLTALLRRRGHLPLTCLFYATALLSKENALSFLPLLLCFDAFTTPDLPSLWRERRPLYLRLFAVTVAWLALRTWVFARGQMPPSLVSAADNSFLDLPFISRVLTAVKVQVLYFRMLLLPDSLLGVYDGQYSPVVESLFSPWGGVSVVAAALALGVLVRGWARGRCYALGVAFYLASFLMTANLFFLAAVFMAERFAFLPSAGYSLVAAALLLPPPAAPLAPLLRRVLLALGLGYLVLLSGLTMARNPDFATSTRLLETAVRRDPDSGRGWYHLADIYQQNGRIDDAEKAFLAAIRVHPDFPDAYYRYGSFLLSRGRTSEALGFLLRAVEMATSTVTPAHLSVARIYLEQEQPREALEWLEGVRHVYYNALYYLETKGMAHEALGETDEAMAIYLRIFGIEEVDTEIPRRLAALLMDGERAVRAEEILRQHLGREKSADTFNLLGLSLAAQGRQEDAAGAFLRALSLDPGSEIYRVNLDKARREGE
jgi:tetratricopeptide (TPR) repeat protein